MNWVLATWNVNSLKVRLSHVEEWLASSGVDVLVLQEIKQVTDAFPSEVFQNAGYHSLASGQKTYNGVAVIARQEPVDPITDFPGFEDEARRILATTIGGVRVINLYVPNGQRVDSEKYHYKLAWLEALQAYLEAERSRFDDIVVLGDFNIAPGDNDVYDAERWGEDILCSPKERAALNSIIDLGFVDVFREFVPDEKVFSWWDYRAGGFRRNAGLRIDLILASRSLAGKCRDSYIDREPRGWERPSDHTPVVAVFDI